MKKIEISKETFNQWVKNGKAQVLTLEKAEKLKGKTIIWSYYGYEHNEQVVYEMTVGNIVSNWDYNKTQPMKGYDSRTSYWNSYMTEAQKQKEKDMLLLLDDEETDSNYIYCHTGEGNCFDVPTFTCSDADRCVWFIIKETK